MKKLYFFILSVLFTGTIFAQGQIMSFTIDPAAPSPTDPVKVYVNLQFSSGGCAVDNQAHNVTGSAITASALHCLGALAVICNTVDTFNLGPLAPGTYTFDFTLSSGFGGSPCSPGIVADDNDMVVFTVLASVGVSDIELSKQNLFIYPNPMTATATVKIASGLKLQNAELKIMDVTGRIVKTISSIQSNELTFDRGELSDGIYIYQLTENAKPIGYGKLVIE
ncbi:MAG TPA: T9SS type A sorting domain-containing protein [Bacteroidia bacterium]|jgi:hypothetical protein